MESALKAAVRPSCWEITFTHKIERLFIDLCLETCLLKFLLVTNAKTVLDNKFNDSDYTTENDSKNKS